MASYEEYPPKADLLNGVRKPLPKVAPGTIDPASMTGDASITQAKGFLDAFNTALASNDAEKLTNCLYEEQAFWRDTAALTSHVRTITQRRTIEAALIHLAGLCGLAGDKLEIIGSPHFVVINPVMMFIDWEISFRMNSPSIDCMGKIILLPIKVNGIVYWKIWILTTWAEQLVQHPEDEKLLYILERGVGHYVDIGGTKLIAEGNVAVRVPAMKFQLIQSMIQRFKMKCRLLLL